MTGASTVARRARTRRGPGRRSGLLLLSLAVPALAWGCFASGAIDAMKSAPAGTLEVVSASLGSLTLAPGAADRFARAVRSRTNRGAGSET